jgi:signal transduction histidine kinase
MRDRGAARVAVDFPEFAPRLAPDAELALFRAAQEALANVVRHASASEVMVQLSTGDQRLRLVVRDNGRGIAPGGANAADPNHLGLAGMRERITALGGSTSVTNVNPHGVEIVVELPAHHARSRPARRES